MMRRMKKSNIFKALFELESDVIGMNYKYKRPKINEIN